MAGKHLTVLPGTTRTGRAGPVPAHPPGSRIYTRPGLLQSMDEKILTLHPEGKRGVNISKAKYETLRKTILEVLGKGELTHNELTSAVERSLEGRFEGSIPWYMECTKLDLEARRVIERVEGPRQTVYRVKA